MWQPPKHTPALLEVNCLVFASPEYEAKTNIHSCRKNERQPVPAFRNRVIYVRWRIGSPINIKKSHAKRTYRTIENFWNMLTFSVTDRTNSVKTLTWKLEGNSPSLTHAKSWLILLGNRHILLEKSKITNKSGIIVGGSQSELRWTLLRWSWKRDPVNMESWQGEDIPAEEGKVEVVEGWGCTKSLSTKPSTHEVTCHLQEAGACDVMVRWKLGDWVSGSLDSTPPTGQ